MKNSRKRQLLPREVDIFLASLAMDCSAQVFMPVLKTVSSWQKVV